MDIGDIKDLNDITYMPLEAIHRGESDKIKESMERYLDEADDFQSSRERGIRESKTMKREDEVDYYRPPGEGGLRQARTMRKVDQPSRLEKTGTVYLRPEHGPSRSQTASRAPIWDWDVGGKRNDDILFGNPFEPDKSSSDTDKSTSDTDISSKDTDEGSSPDLPATDSDSSNKGNKGLEEIVRNIVEGRSNTADRSHLRSESSRQPVSRSKRRDTFSLMEHRPSQLKRNVTGEPSKLGTQVSYKPVVYEPIKPGPQPRVNESTAEESSTPKKLGRIRTFIEWLGALN